MIGEQVLVRTYSAGVHWAAMRHDEQELRRLAEEPCLRWDSAENGGDDLFCPEQGRDLGDWCAPCRARRELARIEALSEDADRVRRFGER